MGSGAAAAGGRPCVERANCRPTLIKRISASTWHQVSLSLSLAYSQRTSAARRSSRHSPVNQSQHTRATSCAIRHGRKTRGFFQEFFSRGRGVSVSETYTQIYIAPKIVRTNPRAPLPILFEVCPLIQPEGLRECCKLPQRGPAENAFSCSKTHLWAVIYDLRDLTIARVPLQGVRATQTRGGGIFSRGWSLPSPEAAG